MSSTRLIIQLTGVALFSVLAVYVLRSDRSQNVKWFILLMFLSQISLVAMRLSTGLFDTILAILQIVFLLSAIYAMNRG